MVFCGVDSFSELFILLTLPQLMITNPNKSSLL